MKIDNNKDDEKTYFKQLNIHCEDDADYLMTFLFDSPFMTLSFYQIFFPDYN